MDEHSVLADSNIWIAHLQSPNNDLLDLVTAKRLFIHPFVIGEVALGAFQNRARELKYLKSLPRLAVLPDIEVWDLIEQHTWWTATGAIPRMRGYIDAHLLASTMVATNHNTPMCLWTKDGRLKKRARKHRVLYPAFHS